MFLQNCYSDTRIPSRYRPTGQWGGGSNYSQQKATNRYVNPALIKLSLGYLYLRSRSQVNLGLPKKEQKIVKDAYTGETR